MFNLNIAPVHLIPIRHHIPRATSNADSGSTRKSEQGVTRRKWLVFLKSYTAVLAFLVEHPQGKGQNEKPSCSSLWNSELNG